MFSNMHHYIDVTWASWHRKSPVTWHFVKKFVQADIKENTKITHYWSSVQESTSTKAHNEFPSHGVIMTLKYSAFIHALWATQHKTSLLTKHMLRKCCLMGVKVSIWYLLELSYFSWIKSLACALPLSMPYWWHWSQEDQQCIILLSCDNL